MAAQRPGIKKNTWFGILVAMLKGVAHLPFWILYRLSDLTFLLMCYVVRYRRAVIDKTCRNHSRNSRQTNVPGFADAFTEISPTIFSRL